MNKTLNIALAGFSFTIEEHAYIKLQEYLSALRSSLDVTEADEVMNDIEIRIVEIFKEILGKREVVNNDDVEKVIAQIGRPEVIEEQEEAYYSEQNTSKNYSSNSNYGKQLFRDPSKQKIAGVCAGLAQYVGMDISVMRAIWVAALLLGIFTGVSAALVIIIYLILWAVVPAAETASDFLRMQGKPVNFESLKQESSKIVQFANESSQRVGDLYKENKPYITSAGSGVWNVLRYVLGIVCAIFAFGFLIAIFAIFGFLGASDFEGINELDFWFGGSSMNWAIRSIIFIATLIPTVLFGYLAVKLLSPKTKIRNVKYVLLGLFLALVSISTYFGVSMGKNQMKFKGEKLDSENVAINTTSDSLIVDINNVNIPQNYIAYDNDLFSDKQTVYKGDYPYIKLTREENLKTPYLIIKKDAEGYNIPLRMEVPVSVENNVVKLPNFFKYPYADRFRDHHVNYELVIPKSMVVIEKNGDKITMHGDVNGNGIDDENEDTDGNDNNSIKIEENKITINGATISYSSDKDSMTINGKSYPKVVGEKIMDSIASKFEKAENVDIKLKDGKKEISIKTNNK